MDQIRQAYDWRINQYSIFSKAVLTSALAFFSLVGVAFLKDEIKVINPIVAIVFSFVIIFFISIIYALCQKKIKFLRQNFIQIYNIISLIEMR